VYCSVTYQAGLFQGQGTGLELFAERVETLGRCSPRSWARRVPCRQFADRRKNRVAAAIVRWVRGQEFGLETLAIEKQTHSRVEHVNQRLVEESGESIE